MNDVVTKEHKESAGRVRNLMAVHSKNEDLINIGAYVTGSQLMRLGEYYAKAIYAKKQVIAEIDYLPTMEEQLLREYFEKRLEIHGDKNIEDFFVGVFHKKLITMFLKEEKENYF
mgnify:CR=1 FL=1